MSVSVIIHFDPEGINKRELNELAAGDCLLDFLIEKYGKDGFTTPTTIFDGDMIQKNEIDYRNYKFINKPLLDNQIINIVHRPLGVELLYAVIIAVVAAVILAPDVSPPPTPENPNFPKTNESPNNRLTGQTNIARPLARIPDIYGRMRVYPDLGAKTVTEYINHIKHVTEYLIIGRGQYNLEDIKTGETLLSEISGSLQTVYLPYEIIPELLDVTRSNEVNGQEVRAPNDDANFNVAANNVTFSGTQGQITGNDPRLAAFDGLTIGTQFTVSGTANNNTTYTLLSYNVFNIPAESPDYEGESFYEIYTEEATTAEANVSGVSFLTAGGNTDIIGPFNITGGTQEIWIDITAPRGLTNRKSGSSVNVTINFDFILEELDSQGNVINTETTNFGISDNTLDARFYTFKFVPANTGGLYQAKVQRLTDTDNDSAFYDITKWSGLSGVNRLEFFDQGNVTSIVLTTKATDQATQSQERKFNAIVTRKLMSYDTGTQLVIGSQAVILDAVAAIFDLPTTPDGTIVVDNIVNPEFIAFEDLVAGDKFTVAGSVLGINDLTYTFVSIALVSSTYTLTVEEETVLRPSETMSFRIHAKLSTSTKMADAMFNHITDPFIGNKVQSDIDLDQLYAIQDALDIDATYGSVLGRFSYSFSADKASVKDELLMIANACRVFIRKIGNRLEFGRDEIRPTRVTLFNSRNKKPRSEKKTIRLHKPTAHDGIELQWVYEDTSEVFTVHFPEDESAINPKKIEAAGIRNFKQAWNRAKIEFNKMRSQRESLSLIVTKEGLNVQVGDRVANADGTDVTAQSGEVKAVVTSTTIETFDFIDFKGETDATVVLRNENGISTEEINATPRVDGVNGFILDNAPAGFSLRIRGDLGYQIGTLYTFALTGEQKIREYVIQKVSPKSGRYVGLSLSNYLDSIYSPDTETPPNHETTVINIALDAVQSNGFIPTDHGVANEAADVETLAWDAAPTGTYLAEDNGANFAYELFLLDSLGNWTITADGNGPSQDEGNGDYRPKVIGNDPTNYEVLFTRSLTIGFGSSTLFGGVSLGVWVPLTGGQGIDVLNASSSGITIADLTCQIREIATPANITTVANFTIRADGSTPV